MLQTEKLFLRVCARLNVYMCVCVCLYVCVGVCGVHRLLMDDNRLRQLIQANNLVHMR